MFKVVSQLQQRRHTDDKVSEHMNGSIAPQCANKDSNYNGNGNGNQTKDSVKHHSVGAATEQQQQDISASSAPTPTAPAFTDASKFDAIDTLLLDVTSNWTEREDACVLAPFNYLLQNPGHNYRSLLIQAFDVWLKCSPGTAQLIDETIAMGHTSSLMVDDIEDGSTLRRGKPSAHVVYGVPSTINAANYVYMLLFHRMRQLTDSPIANPKPLMSGEDVQRMLLAELINLHRGQGLELYWRDNFVCPTEKEYIAMVSNKTSGLFRLSLKMMISQSTTLTSVAQGLEIVPFLNIFGLFFQIRDDYMNLRSGDYAQNKGYCEDLTEGKFSFPIIHALTVGKATLSLQQEAKKNNGSNELSTSGLTFSIDEDQEQLNTSAVLRSIDQFEEQRRQRASVHSRMRQELWTKANVNGSGSGERVDAVGTTRENGESLFATLPERSVSITTHEEFVQALHSRPVDALTKRAIVSYMQDVTQSFRYTCDVMLRLDKKVRQELHRLENSLDKGRPNEPLRSFIDKLRKGWYMSSDCSAVQVHEET